MSAFEATVSSGMSDFEIALAAHNYIIKSVDYTYTPDDAAFCILGAASGAGVVCEGYAKTFGWLMDRYNIDCIYCPGIGNGGYHSWNLIKIDGAWHWVDVTWDDKGFSGVQYAYFGTPDADFCAKHKYTAGGVGVNYCYALPEVTGAFMLMDVYAGGTKLGTYNSFTAAFAAMSDKATEYKIELYNVGNDSTLYSGNTAQF